MRGIPMWKRTDQQLGKDCQSPGGRRFACACGRNPLWPLGISAIGLMVLLLSAGCGSVAERPQTGVASWYGPQHHGKKTASGRIFNQYALTAAHPSLPFGSRVKVTNLANDREVVVTITDRGPYSHGRIIDLSRAAAQKLGIEGTARVRLAVVAD